MVNNSFLFFTVFLIAGLQGLGHATEDHQPKVHSSSRIGRFQADAKAVEERETSTRAEFLRDDGFPMLGDAWQDPSGMIWGDIVKDKQGRIRRMNHQEAAKHCGNIGAELPSREDFIRLSEYMGGAHDFFPHNASGNYSPQVLPNMIHREKNGNFLANYHFWSSWIDPENDRNAYIFDGNGGLLQYDLREIEHNVRCVTRRNLFIQSDFAGNEQDKPVGKSILPYSRTSITGAIFSRHYGATKLGEAWRDPSGMVWGDVARDEKGEIRKMNQGEALSYCKAIGAELPSQEDFNRLRQYMGARSGTTKGYLPQILPNLSRRYSDGSYGLRLFWSSINSFDGHSGSFHNLESSANLSVRCVIQRDLPWAARIRR